MGARARVEEEDQTTGGDVSATPDLMRKAINDMAEELQELTIHNVFLESVVLRQREQLRTLNGVIARRKESTRKLRMRYDELRRRVGEEEGPGGTGGEKAA